MKKLLFLITLLAMLHLLSVRAEATVGTLSTTLGDNWSKPKITINAVIEYVWSEQLKQNIVSKVYSINSERAGITMCEEWRQNSSWYAIEDNGRVLRLGINGDNSQYIFIKNLKITQAPFSFMTTFSKF